MRIGVITDIHNNVVALNAVLKKLHTEGCEQVICCGDERRLFANFGSLGCPAKDGNVARADILTINNGKLDFESIKVLYEDDKVIVDINRLAYPA